MNKKAYNQSIAVIGISCRFPQIDNPSDLWKVLCNGTSVVDQVSKDRWNHEDYYHPDANAVGKTNQNAGAFLNDIHHFDPYFFNVSPKEAIEMSPSQKLMMELAWELFESSSVKPNQFYGSKTGVYLGNIWADFEHLRKVRCPEINNFSAIGQSGNVIANRISYHFGLTGPSLVLDTGCSSSLVALMLAVQSLRDKSSDMCIAGGVNHMLDPEQYVYLSKFGGLSTKGKCSAFDADADGFVRAEGAGTVLLKRLEDAERDGDNIMAVIRGGATTNNGFNVNMPATSKDGQIEVLRQAYNDANVSPSEVNYIEAHGTGTRLGDPVESNSLGEFFSASKEKDNPLLVGSIKTNLGHSESASGIAGALKAIMICQNRVIPKNINFKNPNPKIDFEKLNLKVPTENIAWPSDCQETIKAGVSSYGWGGTNVHMVFEEYQNADNKKATVEDMSSARSYLPLSARSAKALQAYSRKYISLLKENDDTNLRKICYNTTYQKPDFEYKKLFSGADKQELIAQLEEFEKSTNLNMKAAPANKDAKVVFVFPGQGAQWFSMGKELYSKNDVFKATIDEIDEAFKKYADWSLIDEIHADEANSQLNKINVIQPYLFAMQVALSKQWMANGVQPDSVVGHSMGEVAAAYIAGALSLDDAANIICTRSILMNTLSGQGGAMAVTELSKEEAEAYVEKHGGKISLAVQNSPKSTVLAGDNQIIEGILAELNEKDLFCRQVKVDVASHSPQMDSIKDTLLEKVQTIQPQENHIKIYSTVRNKVISGLEMDAEYWKCNLRNTVQFASATEKLLDDGHQLFIEVSPHPVLSTAINECAEHKSLSSIATIGSLHRDYAEVDEMAKNLGLVYENGFTVNWESHYKGYEGGYMPLPSYPLQRENYEIKDLSAHFKDGNNNGNAHPLIGNQIKLADSDCYYWESKISLHNMPFLAHHQVNETAVFPGGFYIEMINSAIRQIEPKNKYSINKLEFVQSVELSEHDAVNIQMKIDSHNDLLSNFKLFKKMPESTEWEMVCSGTLEKNDRPIIKTLKKPGNNFLIQYKREDIYSSFSKLGVTFKDSFQNIENINIDNDVAYATINLDDQDDHSYKQYSIPPLLLDNCLHPLFSKAFSEVDDQTVKTTFVQSIRKINIGTIESGNNPFHVITKLSPLQLSDDKKVVSVSGDIFVYDCNHNLILELIDAKAKIIDTGVKRTEQSSGATVNVLDAVLKEKSNKQRKVLIEEYLINLVADASKASPDQLDTDMKFKNMGIDSLTIVQLRNIIEKQFKVKLLIKLFYDYPSVNEFSNVLLDLLNARPAMDSDADAADDSSNKWLAIPKPNKEASALLFVFNDAGGSNRLFENWSNFIDTSFEMVMIQLPGRDDRTDEPMCNDLNKVLKELTPVINDKIDKPFYIYGHSMGGLIAFEVARKLQNDFDKHAENLIVSGTPCQKGFINHFVNSIFAENYSDQQLLSLITTGSDADFDINNDAIKDLIKMLRNDFELIHGYQYKEMPQLQSKITAVHALSDDRVDIEAVKKWDVETSKEFELITVEGGHNVVYTDADMIASLINSIIMKCKASV
jgi:acyl transferase domain-containing protein/thioesterase domain-containing protein